jgi:hypothetical protein
MAASFNTRDFGRWVSTSIGVAAAAYGLYAGVAWLRYGHAAPSRDEDKDPLLDRFMPSYEVVERHHIRVAAPAEITFAAACETSLLSSPISRAIFRARELVLGSTPDTRERQAGVLALTRSIGWGVLAEVPGREIVMGAVTQPWRANVTFRALAPEKFAAFNEPGWVKIAWTLRADPISATASVFRTETRVIATDTWARRKFRRYWSLLSPGIIIIRAVMLRPVKHEAERRASVAGRSTELSPSPSSGRR